MNEWMITTAVTLGIGVITYFLKRTMSQVDGQGNRIGQVETGKADRQELKESCILIPGCGLRMVLYYVGRQSPVMGITDTGDAVLIVGYDAQNIICYDASRGALNRMGIKDSTVMFEAAGNLFFTYTP